MFILGALILVQASKIALEKLIEDSTSSLTCHGCIGPSGSPGRGFLGTLLLIIDPCPLQDTVHVQVFQQDLIGDRKFLHGRDILVRPRCVSSLDRIESFAFSRECRSSTYLGLEERESRGAEPNNNEEQQCETQPLASSSSSLPPVRYSRMRPPPIERDSPHPHRRKGQET